MRNDQEPLGLPAGSVRAVLTAVLVCVAGAAQIAGRGLDEWFVALVVGAVMSYFALRVPPK